MSEYANRVTGQNATVVRNPYTAEQISGNRFDEATQSYTMFFEETKLVMQKENAMSVFGHDGHSYWIDLDGRPVAYPGAGYMELAVDESAPVAQFIYFFSSKKDPIEKVLVADHTIGGSYLKSGDNKIAEGGGYTSIPVQIDKKGRKFIDLTIVHTGKSKFTFIGVSASGLASNTAILESVHSALGSK